MLPREFMRYFYVSKEDMNVFQDLMREFDEETVYRGKNRIKNLSNECYVLHNQKGLVAIIINNHIHVRAGYYEEYMELDIKYDGILKAIMMGEG